MPAEPARLRRLPRDLHPVAWWLWAIALAAAASLSTNPVWMVLLVSSAAVVVMARRSDQPWGRSFRLYLILGAVIVLVRVLMRILLGGGVGGTVLVPLPEIPLPSWVLGIRLLGPITAESLLAGLYDGLRLAAIVACVGAANSLANPKRLLKSMPPALYEIGTALIVAVTMLPQLAESVHRVRAAQALRGGTGGRVGRLRRFLVPVLEDAFERSLALAAGMDARGYGRPGTASRRERALTGLLMVAGLCGVCVGAYAYLDSTGAIPASLVDPLLWGGSGIAVLGILAAGLRVTRTRYRPDSWRLPELAVVGCAVGVFWLAGEIAEHQPLIAYPALLDVPTVSPMGLLAIGLAVLPAVLAPPPLHALSAREVAV